MEKRWYNTQNMCQSIGPEQFPGPEEKELSMSEPQYHLEGIVHTRTEERADFEGPLDVIFLLLSKNKIEIQDVSITAILEQYLAYLDEMKRLDMEIASEFITMASHLMLIKTKMLPSSIDIRFWYYTTLFPTSQA